MLLFAGYLLFIISVALTAGGVILSSRLRNRYHHEIFSTLLYFQVFVYTFGFYGIWGQVVVKAFLSTYISAGMLVRFNDIAMLLGLPFLVFAWLMLFRFSLEISGRKISNWFIIWFLVFNFSVIIIVGYFVSKGINLRPLSLLRYYFIIFNFIYALLSSSAILFPVNDRGIINKYDKKKIGFGILLINVLQCLPLIFYTSQSYLAMIFTFTFFAGNTFIPVYLSYGTLLTVLATENEKGLSLEAFCKKYEVSPRETDIVREICFGLSNKEISEKLFISLQTVKDHTHRIYIKTNVRSRVQLINLVGESVKAV